MTLPSTSTLRRVLVVDDEPTIRMALARMLGAGYDTLHVTNGAEALALVERGHRFDLILCDMNMPEMTGCEFYERIMAHSLEQALRLIFVSGTPVPQDNPLIKGLDGRQLLKPIRSEELHALIERVLDAERAA